MIEMLLVQGLDLPLYRYGLPVWRRRTRAARPGEDPGSVLEIDDAVFRVVSRDLCHFKQRRIVFGPGSVLMIGCSLRWSGDTGEAIGKMPPFAVAAAVLFGADTVVRMTSVPAQWSGRDWAAAILVGLVIIEVVLNRRAANRMLLGYERRAARLTSAST